MAEEKPDSESRKVDEITQLSEKIFSAHLESDQYFEELKELVHSLGIKLAEKNADEYRRLTIAISGMIGSVFLVTLLLSYFNISFKSVLILSAIIGSGTAFITLKQAIILNQKFDSLLAAEFDNAIQTIKKFEEVLLKEKSLLGQLETFVVNEPMHFNKTEYIDRFANRQKQFQKITEDLTTISDNLARMKEKLS